MLKSLVNLVLQVAGENSLPQVPRSLPLELGSAMHDGSVKYDLTTLLRTGDANFTGNAVVDGNQLLGPVLGLFQALYYLGKATTHINEEAPTYVQVPSLAPISARPSLHPSSQPSTQPSHKPSRQPSSQPTHFPTMQPTVIPSSTPSLLIGCTAGMYSMSVATPQTPMCAVCPAGTFSAHAAFHCTSCVDGRCSLLLRLICLSIQHPFSISIVSIADTLLILSTTHAIHKFRRHVETGVFKMLVLPCGIFHYDGCRLRNMSRWYFLNRGKLCMLSMVSVLI